jgi:hypothetical protein
MASSCGFSLSLAKSTGVPIEKLLNIEKFPSSTLVSVYYLAEKLLIRLRPQIFAYQFVYELTPTNGKELASRLATTSQK